MTRALKTLLVSTAALGFAATAQAGHHGDKMKTKADIVDTAAGDDMFDTLVAAVTAADLVETLKGDGPFTVFAPTDEAFGALPPGTVDTLLKPENKAALVDVLTYHVVPGKVKAGDLSDGLSAETVQGESLTFDLSDGAKVNGVNIVATDVKASNGVIHVVDAVLLPPSLLN